jgi:hypothetical protein
MFQTPKIPLVHALGLFGICPGRKHFEELAGHWETGNKRVQGQKGQ